MKKILKKILEILEPKIGKAQDEFVEVTKIEQEYDGRFSLSYKARKPDREISVDFKDEAEALDYLARF